MSLLEIAQLCKNEQYEDALKALDALPQDVADTEDGVILKTLCLDQLTKFHQSYLLLSQAVIKHPDSNNIRTSWLRAAYREGKTELALIETLKTPALLKESAGLTFDFLQAISRNGRADLINKAEPAIQKHKSQGQISLIVGLILKNFGNFGQAQAFLENAMRSNDDLYGQNKINYVDLLGQALAQKSKIENVVKGVLGRYEQDKETAWFLFQLARSMDATSAISEGYFDVIPPTGIHFKRIPVHEHSAVASKLVFEDGSNDAFANPPDLNGLSLDAGMRELHRIVKVARESGRFANQLHNITEMRGKYAPTVADPIFVMSTGRCGTRSLFELLEKSEYVLPYHSFTQQMSVGDRNHILYRLLTGSLDEEVIVGLAENYLKARTAELMYAYRKNKRPVFVSHLDSIYHPINKALFADSKILYIRRKELEVFKSFYSKNQFGDSQLMPLRFDSQFPNRVFCYSLNCAMEQPQRIAWYLAATRRLGEAAVSTFPESGLTCVANNLFSGDEAAIAALTDFLECPDLDEQDLRDHFSKKINAKSNKTDITGPELELGKQQAEKALLEFGIPL